MDTSTCENTASWSHQLPSLGGSAMMVLITLVVIGGMLLMRPAAKKDSIKKRSKNPPSEDSEEKFETKTGSMMPFPSLMDPASLKLSVVVPAYNEEDRIEEMLDETIEYLQRKKRENGLTSEIIVSDDGSQDDTANVVLKYVRKYGHEQIRLLRLQVNQGKGGAVRMGILRARGEYLLMADADAATRFSDVQKLLAAVQPGEKLAVIVGSRRQSEQDRSILRRFFSLGFNLYTKVVGGVYGLEDTQCGFKLYTREAARIAFVPMRLRRWAFDVESLYLAQAGGARLESVPVRWEEKDGSKLSVVKATINMARDILKMRFNYTTGQWKTLSAAAAAKGDDTERT
eukprot:Plantae.Rhodophyta-Purpureofilum_apyrenoidigerum.ctg4770.p1 GENE.Plantae.Rhodophyta-Purpureofilum_apyrenoidigerum.ctg4770~~Plantae.Rhodophyta-Purpureofilum_apyrenoidigerum.ctg4770.p1  ORF type:complete len:343 (+),score=62.56 Plantae.Rhodophyta-Purpureofilum_apyrenoidigerum.ctg4770:256-1284(+)